MSQTVQKFGILRNKWDRWLSQYKDSIRDVARRAGVDHTQLAKAINTGFASENIRTALAEQNIPADLIPLPSCTRTLAAMVYQQQEIIRSCQKNVMP
jgi:transposase-like protein